MLTQGSVVGPGTGTPQCSTMLAGEPHAAVDWASVFRRSAPATMSGRATMMTAQSAFAASGAGSSDTVGVQPTSPALTSPRTATLEAKRSVPRLLFAPDVAVRGGRGTLPRYRPAPARTVRVAAAARPPVPQQAFLPPTGR